MSYKKDEILKNEMKYEYFTDPVPHIYISVVVPKEIYEKIKFPEIKPIEKRRATKGI